MAACWPWVSAAGNPQWQQSATRGVHSPSAAAISPLRCTALQIQGELQQLSKRLAAVNESLSRKLDAKNEYDRVIAETGECRQGSKAH